MLRALTAFSALFAAAAFGQDGCRAGYICFERGEAKIENLGDVSRFVALHHEKLGLTGNESFSCSIHTWIAEFVPPDRTEYAYVCQQPFVRGVPARYLSMRIDFRSRDGDVSTVRCRCVREDVRLPRPKVSPRQAEERGLRYFYARFPEVSPASIAVVDSQDPLIQWDFGRNGFTLARNVRYRFPLPAPQLISSQDHAEVTVSVDALDESVLRAVGAKEYIFGPGIPMTAFDELNQTLAAMPFGEEQFDVAQRFYAFGPGGEATTAQIEQRLKSRARWEPDSVSHFYALFADQMSAGQLAAFLEDYDLLMLSASFQFMYGSQLQHSGIEAEASGGDTPAAVLRGLSGRARARAEMHMSSSRSASTQSPPEVPGLAEPGAMRFSQVEFVMQHSDALRLYEKERDKRILTLSPVNQLDHDVGLDSF